jgi:DNA-binding transcriptional MocR family regulator
MRWIKLYPKVRESAVWTDPVRFKAFCDLLLSANYKDKDWFYRGQLVKIKRGQFVTSLRKLSNSWGVSKDTVKNILEQFEELGMIQCEYQTVRYTLITIVKYGVYQSKSGIGLDTDSDTEQDTDYDTDSDADLDTDSTQHKNIYKNNKKGTRKKPSPPWGGSAPDDWTAADEDDWKATNRGNTKQLTREEFKAMLIEFGEWHNEGDDGS